MSISPCRKAALRIVSASSTSISRPTGSKRTVWVLPTPLSGRGRTAGRAAALVLGHVALALLGGHLVQEHVGTVEGDPADLVERPHLLGIEVQVRLRDERVPVVADVPERVLHDLGEVLAVMQGLPLALAAEAAHAGRRPALVLGPERDLVGPVAGLRAVRADLAVDLVHHRVLADQARDHARPAAVRVLVVGLGLEGDRLVAVLLRELGVLLPPAAVLVVPARVLELEPLE